MAVPLLLFGANHVKGHPGRVERRPSSPPGPRDPVRRAVRGPAGALGGLDERIAALEPTPPPPARGKDRDPAGRARQQRPGRQRSGLPARSAALGGAGLRLGRALLHRHYPPGLEEGLARCLALGASRVLVLPYFLFKGVLVGGSGGWLTSSSETYPSVSSGGPLSRATPAPADLVARRTDEAAARRGTMSCDRCKFRVPLVGSTIRWGRPRPQTARTASASPPCRPHPSPVLTPVS